MAASQHAETDAIAAFATAAARRIPADLPDDAYRRANAVAQSVLGHHDAHMTWPLWQHAEGHMSRKGAHASIVEGIRRSRTAIIALGLSEVDVTTGIDVSERIADAMLEAQTGTVVEAAR